jgi:protein ImuB
VAARLGTDALELFERASVTAVRPLHVVAPPDTFSEEMTFEAHIETIEPLLFVLRRFIEQLATRIALTGRVVAELQLTLTLESGMRHARTFRVPSPTANIETLFRMVHTHIESLRTDAPIVALQLGAEPVRPEAQQFGLFDSALRDPNHFHETLARLGALLGPERVGTPVIEATHKPDSFHMKTPVFHDGSAARREWNGDQLAGLGLRRFRPPIPAEVDARNGAPCFFSSLAVSSPVMKARGPWEGSGCWWDDRRWVRQEWDVVARDGAVYRLSHADGQWIVEGVYD